MGPSNTSNKRTSDSEASTSKRVASVENGAASPPLRSSTSDAEEKDSWESPLKRVKRAKDRETNKRVIDTAKELKAFISKEGPTDEGVPPCVATTILLRMRVVWTSFDVVTSGPVARIHLVDKRVDDDVEVMHQVFKDGYADSRGTVDSELVTVSLYGADEKTCGIPADGATVTVLRMWSVKLFAGQSCQLSSSVDSIRVEV